ncbi:MAG: type II secretion system protein GspG [Phycisphaeraceae bacterium]|nr:type II secretion system protein GspG [Phycisphaeraceae bacterium]
MIAVAAGVALATSAADQDAWDQQRILWGCMQAIETYRMDRGIYPQSDSQGSWFQKLVQAKMLTPTFTRFGLSPYGIPLDAYGWPMIYETPNASNGFQVVLRCVGQNGVDDGGKLDDLDSRYGANAGYWHKKNWPAAYRRVMLCAALGVAGSLVLLVKYGFTFVTGGLILLWNGVLAWYVIPFGFGVGVRNGNHGPRWPEQVSNSGAAMLLLGVVMLVFGYSTRFDRGKTGCCSRCGYDLRGTLAAGGTTCPECGEAVGDDTARKPLSEQSEER